jgi:hypothetical protein
MMARRTVLGVAVAGAAGLLLRACGWKRGSSYGFRMTVTVDTPAGERSGSSVYEVSAHYQAGLDPSGRVRRWSVKGQAAFVDLPDGRVLFALLEPANWRARDLAWISMEALDPAFRYDLVESARRIARADGVRSPATLLPSAYPRMITFREINDPSSVERVDPEAFPAVFGPGYALERIVLELTDDPVSTDIEKKLPWLLTHRGTLKPITKDVRLSDPSDPDLRRLDSASFSTERFQ